MRVLTSRVRCCCRAPARSGGDGAPGEESKPAAMWEARLQSVFEAGSGPLSPRGLLEASEAQHMGSDAEAYGRILLATGGPEAPLVCTTHNAPPSLIVQQVLK